MIKSCIIFLLTVSSVLVSAQNVVKNPVVIRSEDFKEAVTFDKALAQVYKKIVPAKSAKTVPPCFWILGDKKSLKVSINLMQEIKNAKFDIEPMFLSRMMEAGQKGELFLVNGDEKVTPRELKEIIMTFVELCRSVDSKPVIQVDPSAASVDDGIALLKQIREAGVKHVYITEPSKPNVVAPAVPLPKKRPSSPHRK